ncbi:MULTISPECIES: PP2C family protein-serine/threonine phosphatase [Protofrankia]|uniref:Protein serine/threonine phosphatase n=1 Tax=Candidatus Protofrankia datiscae TaxID=2716812 RepID=F8AYA3_9ACTN|nr:MULTISPECIES: PP2C family protein-serine/threonine phosphatase [Protofrankia]AEH09538.1 protein serine/threonine phosphatase [Candidatus Protofrankia datiscae]
MAPRRHSSPEPGDDELSQTLVQLAGEVLERIKLQQVRVELAMALQRHILPVELPVVPGLRTAACYVPARPGLDIGGDWYDAFMMPGGTVGIVIGDVQGHDVEAAAFVGQVRIGLRAVTSVTTDPGEVLARINDLLVSLGSGLFVTCTFLRFDPASGELADARAGHVPAVWATADGRCEVVLDDGGLPLGMFPGQRYPVTRRLLTGTGAFVLLTDGVVEGPAFPLERGLERVVHVVRGGCEADPDVLATKVIDVADLTGHCDDAAVLVLRHDGQARGPRPWHRAGRGW